MNIIAACHDALTQIDRSEVARTVRMLDEADTIFSIGNGGGYAHASHFASDLRKIAGKQAFAMDNGAELTARANDDTWEQSVAGWIDTFRVDRDRTCVFVFTVGGGRSGVSENLMNAYDRGALTGICGRWRGRLAIDGAPIIIPSSSTPVVEGCQSVIAHHLVEQLCS